VNRRKCATNAVLSVFLGLGAAACDGDDCADSHEAGSAEESSDSDTGETSESSDESSTTGDGDGSGDGDGDSDGGGDGDGGVGSGCEFYEELVVLPQGINAGFVTAMPPNEFVGDTSRIVTDGLRVYEAETGLEFGEPASYPYPDAPLVDGHLMVADDDLYWDMLLTTFSAAFVVARGNAEGGFDFQTYPAPDSATGAMMWLPREGDWNGDENVDVLVRASSMIGGESDSGSIHVYLGDGLGAFAYEGSFDIAGPGEGFEVVRIDDDSLPDIVAHLDGGLQVILNNGDLQPTLLDPIYPPVTLTQGWRVVDVDRDQKQDLLIHDGLRVLFGDGAGNFGEPTADQGLTLRVTDIGFVNDDEHIDLVGGDLDTIQILLGDGAGGFLPGCEIELEGVMLDAPSFAPLDFTSGSSEYLLFNVDGVGPGYAVHVQ
jgi:hypothetical protein